MLDESSRTEVAAAIERINRTWLDRRPADLVPLFHPALTMVFPRLQRSGRGPGGEPCRIHGLLYPRHRSRVQRAGPADRRDRRHSHRQFRFRDGLRAQRPAEPRNGA